MAKVELTFTDSTAVAMKGGGIYMVRGVTVKKRGGWVQGSSDWIDSVCEKDSYLTSNT